MTNSTTTLPVADTATDARTALVCYGTGTCKATAMYPTAMGCVAALSHIIERRLSELGSIGVGSGYTITQTRELAQQIRGMISALSLLASSEGMAQAMIRDLRSAQDTALARLRKS